MPGKRAVWVKGCASSSGGAVLCRVRCPDRGPDVLEVSAVQRLRSFTAGAGRAAVCPEEPRTSGAFDAEGKSACCEQRTSAAQR